MPSRNKSKQHGRGWNPSPTRVCAISANRLRECGRSRTPAPTRLCVGRESVQERRRVGNRRALRLSYVTRNSVGMRGSSEKFNFRRRGRRPRRPALFLHFFGRSRTPPLRWVYVARGLVVECGRSRTPAPTGLRITVMVAVLSDFS